MRSEKVAIVDLKQACCKYNGQKIYIFNIVFLFVSCYHWWPVCACPLFNSNVEAMICAVSTCSKMADNTELAEKLWDFRNVVSARRTFIRRLWNLPFLAIFLLTNVKLAVTGIICPWTLCPGFPIPCFFVPWTIQCVPDQSVSTLGGGGGGGGVGGRANFMPTMCRISWT